MDQYWRRGLSSVSLNEMCRLAGISKPALYREFGGEDGLQAAALDAYREVVVVPMLQALFVERPFAATLDGAIVALTSDRGTPSGCLFTRMRIDRSKLGPLAADRVRQLEQEQLDAFARWYRSGLERGEANPEHSAELAARCVDTQLAAVLVQMGLGLDPESVRQQARVALSPMVAPSR